MDRINPWNSGDNPGSQTKSGDTSRNLDIPDFAPPPDDLEQAPGQVHDRCPCCTAELDVSGISILSVIACPSCRQEFRVLEQFSCFSLEEQLAMGPAGTVYLAKNPPSAQPVALKIFWPELAGHTEYVGRVVGAARTLSGFSHPHIARAFAANVENGLLYAAIEHISGNSLAQTIAKRNRLPELEALTLGSQVVEALQAAANHGLDHGDLKPSNILYTPQGNIKVSDFGHSLPAGVATSAPATTEQLPFYAAPEKLTQQGEDLRSDFYSLGAILFHILTGRPPFPGQTAELVTQKHLEHRAPGVQAFMPEISSAAASMIGKMLEKSPQRRHQTCQELLEDLRIARAQLGAGKSMPSDLQDPGARRKPEGGSSNNWLPLAAAAGPAVLILAVGGWFLFSRHNSRTPEDAPPAAPVAAAVPAEPAPVEPPKTTEPPATAAVEDSSGEAMRNPEFAKALAAVGGGKSDAAKQIAACVKAPGLSKAALCWALAIQGTERLAAGKSDEATAIFQKLAASAKWVDDANLRVSFASLGETASGVQSAGSEFPSSQIRELSCLTLGLKAWNQNNFEDAILLLDDFVAKTRAHPTAVAVPLEALAVSRLPDAQLRDMIERSKKVRSMPDAYMLHQSLAEFTGPLAAIAHSAAERMAKARAEAHKDIAAISPVSAYRIVNRATGLCISAPDTQPTSSVPIVLKPITAGSVAQCWRLPRLAYGQTALANAGYGLGVWTQNKDGSPVAELKSFDEKDGNEEFILRKVDDRYFTIASETGGRLLTAKTDGSNDPTVVNANSRSADRNQQWELVPVPEATKWVDQSDKLEIEWLETIAKSDDEYRCVDQEIWSGHFGTIFDAAGPGSFVTLRIPDVKPGKYEVHVGARTAGYRGIYQLSMGPEKGALTNVGTEQDLFQRDVSMKETVVGEWANPKKQNIALKFTLTGKNSGSKEYFLGLDYIKLVPAK